MSNLVRALIGVAAVGIWISSRPAAAQVMTPTATQRSYNDRGVKKMFDGEFQEAAANFKSSLSLGESNIAWLNYGRALFKLGRCAESREAYDRAGSAAAVAAPSREEIATVLVRFHREWAETCTGSLVLQCEEELTVRLDEGEPTACTSTPFPVVPGKHLVTVPAWEETFEVEVGAEPVILTVERAPEPEPEPEPEAEPEPLRDAPVLEPPPPIEPERSSKRSVGLAVGAAGVAALGTSLLLEALWVAPAFEAYEAAGTEEEWSARRNDLHAAQRINRIVFFSGVGLAAAGAGLVLWSMGDQKVALRLGAQPSVSAEVKW